MSTDQQAGPDPTYGRRALSTRGYVLAGVVPVLIAAALFSLVVWNYDDTDIQGEIAPLLVSKYQPGQDGGATQVLGTLEEDAAGCPVLTTAEGSLAVAWPAGFSARVSPGGTLTVYDPDADPAVRADQEVRATGTLVEVAGSEYAGKACAPADGQVAEIRSEIEIVG